jgi:glutamine amidotransferase
MLVSIVDYDTGNLESVARSVLFAAKNIKKKITIKISKSPDVIFKSDKIILPGQGSYKKCADSIRRVNGLWSSLDSFAKYSGKYILGICVGMQLFSDYGFEEKITKGFGWIPGQVKKIKTKSRLIKLPHIGWNEINFKKKHLVFSGIKNLSHFYFVHSYEFKLKNKITDLDSNSPDNLKQYYVELGKKYEFSSDFVIHLFNMIMLESPKII